MLIELLAAAAGLSATASIAEWIAKRRVERKLQEKQFVVDHLASALLGEESKEEAEKVFRANNNPSNVSTSNTKAATKLKGRTKVDWLGGCSADSRRCRQHAL